MIGRLWIQDFNEKTQAKANGRARVLLVDGHNSHYTKEFLEYARDHKIHVLYYPAHATHIYQGLDVAIFGALKNCWSDEQNQYESATRQKVTKANFISIYGHAHCAIFTPGNIHSAFEATGVWPFNPKVVTAEMMAPSLETSSKNQLPLPQASPIHAINSVMCQYLHDRTTMTPTTPPMAGPSSDDVQTRLGYDQDDPFVGTPSRAVETTLYSGSSTAPQASTTWQLPAPTRRLPQWQIAAKDALDALASTLAAFLIDESPLTSAHRLPPFIPLPISPM